MRETQASTFLWFQDGLEDALNFYKSIFTDFSLNSEDRLDGKLFTADFTIHGHSFIGMNMATTGQNYFNDSISIMIQVDAKKKSTEFTMPLLAEAKRLLADGAAISGESSGRSRLSNYAIGLDTQILKFNSMHGRHFVG